MKHISMKCTRTPEHTHTPVTGIESSVQVPSSNRDVSPLEHDMDKHDKHQVVKRLYPKTLSADCGVIS